MRALIAEKSTRLLNAGAHFFMQAAARHSIVPTVLVELTVKVHMSTARIHGPTMSDEVKPACEQLKFAEVCIICAHLGGVADADAEVVADGLEDGAAAAQHAGRGAAYHHVKLAHFGAVEHCVERCHLRGGGLSFVMFCLLYG